MPSRRKAKRGLYANIQAKRKRIAAGSGETMRRPGGQGAPTAEAFRQSEKTAKTTTRRTAAKRKPAGRKKPAARKQSATSSA